ncbi:hypothetical protein BRC89_01865 [Halobacteriales archaeon QS_4_70_19]|nr:MAG: hypothetical protein BRC89_01865 [Halobacteriales archaeon QS_4_70_19]
MADVSGTGDRESTINPYRRSNDAGAQPGTDTTCELCGDHCRCFHRYGLTACRTCHRDLLPGASVL